MNVYALFIIGGGDDEDEHQLVSILTDKQKAEDRVKDDPVNLYFVEVELDKDPYFE